MNQFRLMLALAGLLMIPGAVGYCESQKTDQPSAEQIMPAENEVAVEAVSAEVARQGALAGIMMENSTEAAAVVEADATQQGDVVKEGGSEAPGMPEVGVAAEATASTDDSVTKEVEADAEETASDATEEGAKAVVVETVETAAALAFSYPDHFYKETDAANPTRKPRVLVMSNIANMIFPGYITGNFSGIYTYQRDINGNGTIDPEDLDDDGDGVANGDDSYPGNPFYWGN